MNFVFSADSHASPVDNVANSEQIPGLPCKTLKKAKAQTSAQLILFCTVDDLILPYTYFKSLLNPFVGSSATGNV